MELAGGFIVTADRLQHRVLGEPVRPSRSIVRELDRVPVERQDQAPLAIEHRRSGQGGPTVLQPFQQVMGGPGDANLVGSDLVDEKRDRDLVELGDLGQPVSLLFDLQRLEVGSQPVKQPSSAFAADGDDDRERDRDR